MTAPPHPEVIIPANAEYVRRETFREYFERIHRLGGRWNIERERHDETLQRFMDTMADYVDAVTRNTGAK